MAAQKPFRVILVGGGLVSLTAAHILSKMDVDFVILEQHDSLTPSLGSLLSLWGPTFRTFDQLGIMDTIRTVLDDVDRTVAISADDGSIMLEEHVNNLLEQNHGHPVRVSHRPLFVEALYQSLPELAKARIHVNKRVVNIDVFDHGVSVQCADGTVEEGSIIIGADGVHSRTRQCMEALQQGRQVNEKSSEETPYTTTYRMLFGNVPVTANLENNINWEGSRDGVSTQLLVGKNHTWFAVYEKVDQPTKKRIRYTEDDKLKILEKWGDLYMTRDNTLRDIYEMRTGDAGLINLEEGLVDEWSWKRIILVGDAVHKLAPQAGLGYNSGLADFVVLANELRRLLQTEASPSTESLERMSSTYQSIRMEDMSSILSMSMQRARLSAWLSWKDRIIAKYIVPYTSFNRLSISYVLGPIVSRVPVLEWLDEKEPPVGSIPYVHHPISKEKRALSDCSTLSQRSNSIT